MDRLGDGEHPGAPGLGRTFPGSGVPHGLRPYRHPLLGATTTSSAARTEARGAVLRDAHLLRGVPGTLVQGSLDFGNLLGIVWRLHHAWPDSELTIVDEAGHDAGDMGDDALVAATDRYARRGA
ncbi:hypothetical protein GCM10023238_15750 [Streptomyces heliomycini]